MLPTEISRLAPHAVGQWRAAVCPWCSSTRSPKHRRVPTLSVVRNPDESVGWHCNHCGEKGRAKMFQEEVTVKPAPRSQRADKTDLALHFMSQRGISEQVFKKYGCYQVNRYFTGSGREEPAVAFPVIYKGNEASVKYRAVSGKLFAASGSPPVLFGLNQHDPENKTVIISEGEVDALSWAEAGITNSFSVPTGASVSQQEKGGWLWLSREVFDASDKIILALDNDEPGQAAAEEIARRIGKHRVWRIDYPDGCKDANDVLREHGPERLRQIYQAAQPWPVTGLYDANHYTQQVHDLIQRGEDTGLSTGLQNVDEIFRIGTGQLIMVTGIPGSGKSEFIDHLLVNLAEQHGWRAALCSFENSPPEHIRKLVEKRARATADRADKVDEAIDWVAKHFFFIRFDDGSPATIEAILERARVAVLRYGIRSLVIDPYNYITRSRDDSETQFVSDLLTQVRSFAVATECNVWFVAHPQKLMRSADGSYPMPKGYDISGSAAWFAKADSGLTVGRGQVAGYSVVSSWKARHKRLGKLGFASLAYDVQTGRFSDVDGEPINVEVDEFKLPEEDKWWNKG